jgi:hypothetical protein
MGDALRRHLTDELRTIRSGDGSMHRHRALPWASNMLQGTTRARPMPAGPISGPGALESGTPLIHATMTSAPRGAITDE